MAFRPERGEEMKRRHVETQKYWKHESVQRITITFQTNGKAPLPRPNKKSKLTSRNIGQILDSVLTSHSRIFVRQDFRMLSGIHTYLISAVSNLIVTVGHSSWSATGNQRDERCNSNVLLSEQAKLLDNKSSTPRECSSEVPYISVEIRGEERIETKRLRSGMMRSTWLLDSLLAEVFQVDIGRSARQHEQLREGSRSRGWLARVRLFLSQPTYRISMYFNHVEFIQTVIWSRSFGSVGWRFGYAPPP